VVDRSTLRPGSRPIRCRSAINAGRISRYYYAAQRQGEASPLDADGVATGINDHHIHPAEPRTLRAGVTWFF